MQKHVCQPRRQECKWLMLESGETRRKQLKSLFDRRKVMKQLLKECKEKHKELTAAFFHFSNVHQIIWCG
jgi:hypothetical protein